MPRAGGADRVSEPMYHCNMSTNLEIGQQQCCGIVCIQFKLRANKTIQDLNCAFRQISLCLKKLPLNCCSASPAYSATTLRRPVYETSHNLCGPWRGASCADCTSDEQEAPRPEWRFSRRPVPSARRHEKLSVVARFSSQPTPVAHPATEASGPPLPKPVTQYTLNLYSPKIR